MQASLAHLRSTIPYRAMQYKHVLEPFPRALKTDYLAVRVTGGIGDLLIGIGLAEAVADAVGRIVIYSKWPEIVSLFSKHDSRNELEILPRGLDCILNVNSLGTFYFSKNFDGFTNTKVADLYVANQNFLTSDDWPAISEHHPHMDNILASEALRLGYDRESLMYASLGLDPRSFYYDIDEPKKFDFDYITIHDGFDSFHSINGRSTKNWSMKSWRAFVIGFKKLYPNIKVVQLGGQNSRRIPGVDVDRVGLITFRDSLSILNHSLLHIDGDSGLVHAGKILGVRSVVMFGPTPPEFFGYKRNVNLKPKFCGNCWWLKKDWVSKCCLGYDEPECMDAHEPMAVLKEVSEVLLYV